MSKLICSNAVDSNPLRELCKACIWLLASSVLLLVLAGSLAGQEPAAKAPKTYDVMPIAQQYVEPPETGSENKEQARALRAEQRKVRDLIRSTEKELKIAVEGNGDLSKFEGFMREYVFARMTQTNNENLASLGEQREDFLDEYLSDKVQGNARQKVIQTTIPIMQKIAEGKYHEAVRLNAILMLGLVDDQPASRSSGTLPAPSNDALPFLTQVFTGDKYPAFLKVGALAGIQRHAEIDHLRTQTRMTNTGPIVAEALAIVQGGGAGADTWPREAKYWLERRSIQVLGYLGQPGANGTVVDELIKVAADENASMWLRFDAIAALGNLNYGGVAAAKVADVPKIVANYVAETADLESADLEDKLYRLIETNILYEDIDLEEIGNADDEKNKKPERKIGVGGADFDELTNSRSSASSDKIDLGPRVEIATYHLNNSRQKVKVVAYTAKQTLSSTGLMALVDKAMVTKLNQKLEKLIQDADVGIKDNEAPELVLDENDPNYEEKLREAKKTNTLKMSEVFAAAAKDIRGLFPAEKAATEQPATETETAGSN